jgi:hypothetical protein
VIKLAFPLFFFWQVLLTTFDVPTESSPGKRVASSKFSKKKNIEKILKSSKKNAGIGGNIENSENLDNATTSSTTSITRKAATPKRKEKRQSLVFATLTPSTEHQLSSSLKTTDSISASKGTKGLGLAKASRLSLDPRMAAALKERVGSPKGSLFL